MMMIWSTLETINEHLITAGLNPIVSRTWAMLLLPCSVAVFDPFNLKATAASNAGAGGINDSE
jgi:hypothetical protein